METKMLKLVVPAGGSSNSYKITISPGATVKTIKNNLPQVADYAFFKAWDGLPVKETVDLFEIVRDGSLIYAASYQDVGGDSFP